MTRSQVAVATAISLGSIPLLFSSISLSYSAQQLHVAFASIACMSSTSLTCPLHLPHSTFSTTPPSVLVLSVTTSSQEHSSLSRHSHPYNLCSRVSLPPESSGIGLISPLKSTNISWTVNLLSRKLSSKLGKMWPREENPLLTWFLEKRTPSLGLIH